MDEMTSYSATNKRKTIVPNVFVCSALHNPNGTHYYYNILDNMGVRILGCQINA